MERVVVALVRGRSEEFLLRYMNRDDAYYLSTVSNTKPEQRRGCNPYLQSMIDLFLYPMCKSLSIRALPISQKEAYSEQCIIVKLFV